MSEIARDDYVIEIRPAESDEWSLLLMRAELSRDEARALIDVVQEFLNCRPRADDLQSVAADGQGLFPEAA
jgi:hypothetical protein